MSRFTLFAICLLVYACAASHNNGTFQAQFDHFYPDDPQYVTKMYRDAYIKFMRDPAHAGDLGAAMSGDSAALTRFLQRASTEKDQMDGERGETYAYDLRFLLIRVGDHHFASSLRQLTRPQREEVALSLDCLISRERNWFPETTSLYEYRWKAPNQALQPTAQTALFF